MELVLTIMAAVGNLFLGLFTYLKNPKSATHKQFFLFVLAIVLYILINYFSLHQQTNEATLFWLALVVIVAVFINWFFFIFVTVFPSPSAYINRNTYLGSLLFTILFIPLALNYLIFRSVIIKPSNIETVPGPAMPLFLLHTILFLGTGFWTLIKKLRISKGVEQIQIRLLLLGMVFMFVSILVTNVLLVLLFNFSGLVSLLPLYTLIFVSFISYAIIKHRFLDIGLVVARTVSYTLLLLILGLFYAAGLFVAGTFISKEQTTTSNLITSTVLALVMAFSFQPLRRLLEKITDRIFYKGHYDSQELLSDLTKVMASTFELESLTSRILKVLLRTARIGQGMILLLNKDHLAYQRAEDYGEGKIPVIEFDEAVRLIGKDHSRSMLVFDELPGGQTKKLMREKGFNMTVPLVTKSGHIGLLALGEKSSGDIYSEQDIQLLKILAPELAIAIQNAQAFDEIKKFNVTLREEIKKATADLRKVNERLRALDKLKDEFLSLAGHELRTPMTAIKSYLWMVLNKKQEDDVVSEKTQKYLERSYESTERLINLVNDMLDVSRIESGKVELNKEEFNLCDIGVLVKEEVAAKLDEIGLTMDIMPCVNIPKVHADKNKIHQVMLNLVGNALKFTSKGGKITMEFKRTNGMVETAIKDTGKGISKEDQGRLFTKFGRLEGSYSSIASVRGTGLGLYLCKQYLELHAGKIWVESEVGKGATFTFSLPVLS